jgi:RNA polymerase sigma-70 factor (ECF subfamily)
MHMLLRYLRRTGYFPEEGRPTDGQLLDQFVARREEAAFEELVRRHGPMVLGVCRRVLANEHDVEDAFQATFLVLVRKAASVKPRDLVGHWLHGVAYRTAVRARALNARRRAKEQAMRPVTQEPPSVWQDLLPLLDQELTGLPEKYRIPVVLCDLQGKSRKEVAGVLGWSEGTLSSRLARARALLGRRLSHRGVTLAGADLTALVAAKAAPAGVPSHLLHATTKAALLVAAQAPTAAWVSLNTAALTEGVVRTMFFAKFKTVTVLCAVAALAIGAGGFAYHAQAEKGDPNLTAARQEPGRPAPAPDEREAGRNRKETEKAQPQANDESQQTDPDLPRDAAKRIREFEAEAEAIQKKADAEIQARRDKLIVDLQALVESYTKAGKLAEAEAIRQRLEPLKAVKEKARQRLLHVRDRAHNLLVNGSFEEGPATPNDGIHNLFLDKDSTAFKGWLASGGVGAGPIDSVRWPAADGNISFCLNWSPGDELPGTISQTFKTRKGQKYRVSFWMAGSALGPPAKKEIQISAGGQKAVFAFDAKGKTRADPGWVRKSWELTAEADQTTLEFAGRTRTVDGALIDDVVVVAANE